MKIYSKSLYPYVKRALDKVRREEGNGKTIMLHGSWVNIEKNHNGDDVAVFYTFRGNFDYDFVEKALRVFIGDIQQDDDMPFSPVLITDTPEREWKKQQAALIKAMQTFLERQGVDKDRATMEAMYAASEFGQIKEGTCFGHEHFEDLQDIAETALNTHDSVTLRISRSGDPIDWDGHILIEVIKTETSQK